MGRNSPIVLSGGVVMGVNRDGANTYFMRADFTRSYRQVTVQLKLDDYVRLMKLSAGLKTAIAPLVREWILEKLPPASAP